MTRLLFLLFLLPFADAQAQSTPAETGFRCAVQGFFGYGIEQPSAFAIACASAGGVLGSGGGDCRNPNNNVVLSPAGCTAGAVCLTGDGYIAADSSGFCPDPPDDSDSDGDDDNGDGSDCDPGEEDGLDCNDGDDDDTDSDGDGEPDSQDNDDGICSPFNDGDLDCESSPEECVDQFELFDFQFSQYSIPPSSVCYDGCTYTDDFQVIGDVETGTCFDRSDGTGVGCIYGTNGNTCTGCDAPQCSGGDACPRGEHSTPDGCVDTEEFCTIDENNNGIPDNQQSPVCRDFDCDPTEFECGSVDSDDINCDDPRPVCDTGDPVSCAIANSQYDAACGIEFSDIFDCESEFTCDGNRFECASLEFKHEQACATYLTDEQLTDPDNLTVFREGVDDGTEFRGGEGVDGSVIDISNLMDDIDSSGYGFGSACFQDFTFSYGGRNYTIEFSKLCPFLDVIRWTFLIVSSIVSIRIVASSF